MTEYGVVITIPYLLEQGGGAWIAQGAFQSVELLITVCRTPLMLMLLINDIHHDVSSIDFEHKLNKTEICQIGTKLKWPNVIKKYNIYIMYMENAIPKAWLNRKLSTNNEFKDLNVQNEKSKNEY